MAITVNEKLIPDWYIPEGEIDEEEKAEFRLKPMNGSQGLEVMKGGSPDLRLALLYGLLDWKNIKKENGNQVEYKSSKISLLPTILQAEIANEIIARSNIAGDEKKT